MVATAREPLLAKRVRRDYEETWTLRTHVEQDRREPVGGADGGREADASSSAPWRMSAPAALPIILGPLTVAWWPADDITSDESLYGSLHETERVYAQRLKSLMRRREFLRSRALIRAWSGDPSPLIRDDAGVVAWPTSLLGSLTHKDGAVAVTLVPRSRWLALGIDAEAEDRMQLGFENRLARPEESSILDALADGDSMRRRTLLTALFSFKESIFKCCFPLGRIMFHFHDAALDEIDLARGHLRARILRDVAPEVPAGSLLSGWVRGYQENGRNYILTAAAMARNAATASD